MKANKGFFISLRIISDVILIPIAIIVAYSLKFKLPIFLDSVLSINLLIINPNAQVEPYLAGLFYITLIWIISYAVSGVYRIQKGVMPEIDETLRLIKGSGLAAILIMAGTFLYPFIPGSRFVILYSAILAIGFCGLVRIFLYRLERKRLLQGKGSLRAIIIGVDHIGQDLAEKMVVFPFLRFNYRGHIDSEVPEKIHYHLQKNIKILGHKDDTLKLLKQRRPDAVFITKYLDDTLYVKEIVEWCESKKIQVYRLSAVSNFMSSVMAITDLDGLPFIEQKEIEADTGMIKIKEGIDSVLSIFLLLILSPVLGCIAAMNKFSSPEGPVFYCQERVGFKGRPFKMIKFRTMIPDAEKNGPQYVNESEENRYISCGKWLRKYSLDELPQLLNVIRGEMSLVGPRPERPQFVKSYEESIPYFAYRHEVKGGLTGWAQVNGRSVLTRRPEHKLSYDLYYVKNMSLGLDLNIILKTITMVLRGEEAY